MSKILRFGTRMTRLRLRTRIFVGFAVLIVLLLGIAGFGSYGLSVVGEEIDKMDGIAGNANRSQELALRMEQIRRGVADFEIDGKPAALEDVSNAVTRASALLKESADYTLSEKRRAMFNGIIETMHGFTAKQAHFAAVRAAGAAERNKLLEVARTLAVVRKQLAEAAAASDDASDAAPVAAVQIALLTAETSSLRFLTSRDPEWVPVFKKDAAAAAQALAALDRSAIARVRSALPPVVSALDLYTTTFDMASAATTDDGVTYTGQIRPVVLEMQHATSDSLDKLIKAFSLTSQKAAATSSDTLMQQLELSGGATLIGLVLAVLIARTIVRPINSITTAMTRLVSGDTASVVPGRDNTDEIGEMARAVEVFRRQAIEKSYLAAAQEREQAAKERRQKTMDRNTEAFGGSVAGVMDSFMAASASMRQAASDVAEGARRTRLSTSSTVESALSSARDLNAVAAAAEEMAASINEVSSQVAHVTTSVQAAVDRAAETDAKVASLSQAADRIGDVVRIISDIAGQTNLLALNATIEAARAGEAGKGFAVVAGEVKALASQTARATDQIGTQIVAIRGATGEAVAAVRDVGAAISQVEAVAAAIATAVEMQATATREITASVQVVTANTSVAADAMRGVLSIVEGTDSSSTTALTASEEVGRTADTLRSKVADFLSAVARGDDGERRRHERIPANDMPVTLKIAGHLAGPATIRDISRSGVGLACNCSDDAGAHAEVTLPGGASIGGNIVRSHDGSLAIAFHQDQASLTQIDRALAFVRDQFAKHAAA